MIKLFFGSPVFRPYPTFAGLIHLYWQNVWEELQLADGHWTIGPDAKDADFLFRVVRGIQQADFWKSRQVTWSKNSL